MQFVLTAEGLTDFSVIEGGGRPCLPYEGYDPIEVISGEIKTKDMDNPAKAKAWVTVQMRNEGADAGGVTMTTNVFFHGKDKDGNNMSRQFWQFLISLGMTTEDRVREHAQQNKTFDMAQMLEDIKAKKGYIYHQWDEYKGRMYSDVKGFLTETTYRKHEENGNLKTRTDRPASLGGGSDGPGAGSGRASTGGGAAKGEFKPTL